MSIPDSGIITKPNYRKKFSLSPEAVPPPGYGAFLGAALRYYYSSMNTHEPTDQPSVMFHAVSTIPARNITKVLAHVDIIRAQYQGQLQALGGKIEPLLESLNQSLQSQLEACILTFELQMRTSDSDTNIALDLRNGTAGNITRSWEAEVRVGSHSLSGPLDEREKLVAGIEELIRKRYRVMQTSTNISYTGLG